MLPKIGFCGQGMDPLLLR